MSDEASIPSGDVLSLDQTLVQGTLAACTTVLLYEHLCTLDQEVAYVWSNPWSISSLLFFANRYGPFVDTFLSLYLKFSYLSPEKCHVGYSVVTWFIVLGTLISESILLLRTYAIWDRSKPILITLCILALIVFIPAMIVTDIEYKSLIYGTVHSEPIPGCQLIHASPIIFTAYVLLVFSETIMVILTSIKAYRHLQHSRSGWVVKMYQDGIVFYFYVLAISLANILVPLLAPPVFANWLASPQRILHSILCSRVLFLIFRQRSATTMTNRLTPRPAQPRYHDHLHPGSHQPGDGSSPQPSRDGSDVPIHGYYYDDTDGGGFGSTEDGLVFTEMAETDTSLTLNILHPSLAVDAYGGDTQESILDEEVGYDQLASGSTGGSRSGHRPGGSVKESRPSSPPIAGPSRAGPSTFLSSSSHSHLHPIRSHSRTSSGDSHSHIDSHSHHDSHPRPRVQLHSPLFPAHHSHYSHILASHHDAPSPSRIRSGKGPSSSTNNSSAMV